MRKIELKSIGHFAVLLITFNIYLLEGCMPCEEFFGIEDRSTISFDIKDKNRFIFDVYSIDSFRVYLDNKNFEAYSTSQQYGSISLDKVYNEDTDQAAFTSQVCKEFVFRYTYTEMDIVKICFVAKPEGNCGNEFYVKNVFYNGKDLGTAFPRTLYR